MKLLAFGLSQQGDKIFCGSLLKDGRTLGHNAQDVTESAIASVAECLLLTDRYGYEFVHKDEEYRLIAIAQSKLDEIYEKAEMYDKLKSELDEHTRH